MATRAPVEGTDGVEGQIDGGSGLLALGNQVIKPVSNVLMQVSGQLHVGRQWRGASEFNRSARETTTKQKGTVYE
jgi:hypothetical protein